MPQSVGKIGVIIPYIRDVLYTEYLEGIRTQAEKLCLDTLVFTICYDELYHPLQPECCESECSIYQLPFLAQLDGIVISTGKMKQESFRSMINGFLKDCNVPCLMAGTPLGDYPCLVPPQTEAFEQITLHMLCEHPVKSCYLLNGPEGNWETTARLEGFRRAVKKAGLPESRTRIFYGDFWKESAQKLARQIAEGEIPMPDAIVCANDMMAITLCDTLTECGIAVPDRIRISGYDGVRYALDHYPMITTLSGMEFQFGQLAVNQLYEMMTGKQVLLSVRKSRLLTGTSCGCTPDSIIQQERSRLLKGGPYYGISYPEIHTTAEQFVRLSESESLSELIESLKARYPSLLNCRSLSLCVGTDALHDDSADIETSSECDGQMQLLFTAEYGLASHENAQTFSKKKLLPAFELPHTPSLWFFTSLYYRDTVFGYTVSEYETVSEFCNRHYHTDWFHAAAYGLHSLQNRLYTKRIELQMQQYLVKDQITGMYNRKGFLEQIPAFFSHSQKDAVLLLMHCQLTIEDSMEQDVRHLMLLSNVIQLTCGIFELAARVHSEVYAVLIPCKTEMTVREQADRWILHFQSLLETLRRQEQLRLYPRILSDAVLVSAEQVNTAEALLEERMQVLFDCVRTPIAKTSDLVEQLEQIRREIHLDPQFPWTVPMVAHRLAISISYLQKIYLRQFGISVKGEIIAARMNKAKKLLARTNLHVTEIAVQCGYSDVRNFMRAFKKHTGITATQFSRQQDIE